MRFCYLASMLTLVFFLHIYILPYSHTHIIEYLYTYFLTSLLTYFVVYMVTCVRTCHTHIVSCWCTEILIYPKYWYTIPPSCLHAFMYTYSHSSKFNFLHPCIFTCIHLRKLAYLHDYMFPYFHTCHNKHTSFWQRRHGRYWDIKSVSI